MSNQQDNNTQVDNDIQQPLKQRPRSFYRTRPGNERQNQDLAEDENRPVNDADDGQRSNNSDENNTRIRGPRGGFRRGRGRGRFMRGVPFYNYRRGYSPYTNYVNGREGIFVPPGGFYGQPYHGVNDLVEQEGLNNYPIYGNRPFRGGRGRGRRRGQGNNNENTDSNNNNNNDNEQQQGEDNDNTTTNNNNKNINKRRKRRQRRRTNDNGSGTEQQTDDVVTDDAQKDENNKGSGQQRRKKSNRRRSRRNTNASQSGAETEERVKSGRTKKPKDDETIVKYLLRSMVGKVARRLTPRVRRRSRANTKDANENTTDVEQSQTHNPRRGGGRNRRAGRNRPGNGYFIEQGYYDPYGMAPYYYGAYYGFGGRGSGGPRGRGRGRGRGGRGRGRGRQQGDANKENQPEDNNEQGKLEADSNPTGDNSQTKPAISEQVNQSS